MVRQIATTQQQNQRAENHVKSELEYASIGRVTLDERLPVFSQTHTQRQSYFLENNMNDIKEKALAKLLEELNQPHVGKLSGFTNISLKLNLLRKFMLTNWPTKS